MKMKRIVSVLLSFVLGVAVLLPATASAENSTTTEEVVYSDEFAGEALTSDWKASSSNAQVSEGTLNSNGNKTFWAYLSELEAASSWTDYSVEADVTITTVDGNGKAISGVAIRASENSWYGGYIMKLSYSDQKVYLYSGKSDGSTGLVTLVSTAMEVGLNQTYHMELTAKDEAITGYINGTMVLEYTASADNMTAKSAKKNDAGYPGVLVNNGTVTIDNFVVTEIKTVIEDSDALFSDSFAGTSFETGWSASGNGQVSDGTMNGVEGKSFYAYLNEIEGASEWADYSVAADLVITAADSSGKALAGVAVRSSETSWYGGYIMKMSYLDQKVYLYSGKSDGSTGLVTLTSATMEIGLNQNYHVELSVEGTTLTGYINETKVLEYTASEDNMTAKSAKKNDAGYPGVLVNNGTVTIDNFVVTKIETVISDSDTLFSDEFKEAELNAGWSASGNGQVSDGTMNGVDGKTFYAYLSEIEGASSWTDYSVDADVTITATDSSDKAVAGIAIRSSEVGWYGGYIMKMSYSDQKVYLYSGKSDGTSGLVTLTSVAMEVGLNQTYRMKLLIVDEKILGYVDEELVLEYIADEENMIAKSAKKNDAGYPGVLVNNGNITIDNFVVTRISENSIVIGKVGDNATVYVDGKQSAEAKMSGIVQANPGQSVQIITIDSEDSNKVSSNEIYLVKTDGTVMQPECLQNAISYEGTAIRTTGNKGIRFKSSITKTAKAGDEEFALKEYGTVVTKETILNGDDLYLGATYATVKGVAYEKDSKDMIFAETDTLVQFTGVLINITESNYSTTYVARPYAIYQDTEGTQYKIYGNMVGRSLSEIAQLALADTEYGYTEDEKTYFQSIVDKVTGGQTE